MSINCILFILTNTISVQYNRKFICKVPEEYEHAKAHQDQFGNYQANIHYVLTLVNMTCYSATFSIFQRLQHLYSKKKDFLQNNPTPKKVKEE